jgi:hypothetical protein
VTDHRNIVIPCEVDDDDLDGFEALRERKEALGVTWLEFVNGVAPEPAGPDVDVLAERLAAALDRSLVQDVEEAAYTGAREAVQEGGLR